jgi:hypothetical protein
MITGRWKVKDFLTAHGITPYRLWKDSKLAQKTVYTLANDKGDRIDLGTFGRVVSTLSRLTGQPVTPNDLLEVIEEPPKEIDAETKAWLEADLSPPLEPYDWGETGVPTGYPISVKGNTIMVQTGNP